MVCMDQIKTEPIKTVCVYCGSGAGSSPRFVEAALALGKSFAENNIRLVYGGGSVGLMGAIAKSTLDHGGLVTGIIPDFLKSREHALSRVQEMIVTPDMHERKRLMFEHSDAFVALPGGIGTLEELVEQMTWQQLGRHSKPMLDTEDQDFDAIMAVNVRGPFMLCRAAVRQMLSQPARGDARGRIVNITSQHGMVGAPGHAAYAISKAGLVQLTRQIAVEHGRDGIICNSVAPGKIVTGTPGDLSQNERSAEYVRSRTPFARFGEPRDVAAAVSFLASDDARYVSGATLMVDGGWMAY